MTQQKAVKRPMSPHLQVYKMRVHMLTSILHRITGSALMVGTFIMAWFFVAMAMGHESFNSFMAVASSIPGKLVLFGITLALMQHMASGVRHLFMDTGALFDLKANTNSAVFTYVFTVAGTIAVWVAAYAVVGAG